MMIYEIHTRNGLSGCGRDVVGEGEDFELPFCGRWVVSGRGSERERAGLTVWRSTVSCGVSV